MTWNITKIQKWMHKAIKSRQNFENIFSQIVSTTFYNSDGSFIILYIWRFKDFIIFEKLFAHFLLVYYFIIFLYFYIFVYFFILFFNFNFYDKNKYDVWILMQMALDLSEVYPTPPHQYSQTNVLNI